MLKIFLIGMGTGNPEHMTLEGLSVMKKMDVILLPRKNKQKEELLSIREHICENIIKDKKTDIKEYKIPKRKKNLDYRQSVDNWHQKISDNIFELIKKYDKDIKLGFLVWGDPGLYDSTIRIISKMKFEHSLKIVSGISSIQSFTSAHSISLNEIGESVLITTGRKLNKEMFKDNQNVMVFLDGKHSFNILDPKKYYIWWGAYLGMKKQILIKGKLKDVYKKIISKRKKAKSIYGWIMDTYLLKKIN